MIIHAQGVWGVWKQKNPGGLAVRVVGGNGPSLLDTSRDILEYTIRARVQRGHVTLNFTTPPKKGWPLPRPDGGRESLWENIMTLAVAAILAWLIFHYLLQFGYVHQSSMSPTLAPGERILINVLSPRYRLPERGEIVVFTDPRGVEGLLVKRVVGLPGDTVEIRRGVVLVNEVPLPEAPTVQPHPEDLGPVAVPPGHLYVIGDNRPNSLDSRGFGPIPADSVRGFPVVRLWPLDRLGFLQ